MRHGISAREVQKPELGVLSVTRPKPYKTMKKSLEERLAAARDQVAALEKRAKERARNEDVAVRLMLGDAALQLNDDEVTSKLRAAVPEASKQRLEELLTAVLARRGKSQISS